MELDFNQALVHDLGQMFWLSLYASKTYSGYPLDEVKSTLQKSIRRNWPELALQAAGEMWRMREVNGLAAQTNLYNRIAVIAAEDIGLANIDLALLTINYVLSLSRARINYFSFMSIN